MPPPIHDQADDWLAASLLNDLTPEERRAFDEHLAACERCRKLQEDTLAMDEKLQRDFAAAAGPSAGFETRLVSDFRQRQERGGRARLLALMGRLMRLRGVQVAGVAALLLALVEVGNVVTTDGGRSPGLALQALKPTAALTHRIMAEGASGGQRLDAPSVSTKSGSKADVPITNEFLYPTQFQPPQIPQNFKSQKVLAVEDEEEVVSTAPAPEDRKAGMAGGGNQPTLRGSNTYTGAIAVNGGKLSIGGTAQPGGNGSSAFYDSDDLSRAERAERARDAQPLQFGFDASLNVSPASPAVSGPVAAPVQAQAAAPAESAPAPAPTPAAPDARKLIRNARAELEVAGFDAAVDSITAAAAQDGGYIDTKNSARGANGKLSGALVVKILPDNLERFLQRLRPLGEVKNQTVQTEDITKAYFDTDARLRNSKRMEDRLLKMLDEVKGKMSEVLQVEKELGRVRSDIEQMQGELKLYDAQVRYATVNLRIYEKDLHQPAAFLLRETANLALLAYDVEKTFAEARRIADAAKAQTLESNMVRDGSRRVSGTLRLLVAPDAAAGVIAQVKALGRVENYTLQDERVAQNGSSNSNAAGADSAKVERAPVTFVINISHDEQTRRQVSLTLVAKDVDAAFDKARAAAASAGGETVNSNVTHPQNGHSRAVLTIRVPARSYANLLEACKALGRTADFQTQRTVESNGAGLIDDGPTLLTLTLADAEPPAQQTGVSVLTSDVEKRLAEIKQSAAATGVEAQNSTFSRESDGSEQAALSFRLPMSAYPAFIDRVRALGEVKDFTVQRQDRPANAEAARGGVDDTGAPVEVSLRLYSQGRIVGENSGLGATLRRTFAQGAGALMWSVQMIGVALAFLAPWVGALALAVWLGRRFWRRRRAALPTGKKPE